MSCTWQPLIEGLKSIEGAASTLYYSRYFSGGFRAYLILSYFMSTVQGGVEDTTFAFSYPGGQFHFQRLIPTPIP